MKLSDDELAMVFEGKAMKLKAGEKSREELRDELYELTADLVEETLDEDFVKRGPLQSQGRVSFGRSNEGQVGRALFIPEEGRDR